MGIPFLSRTALALLLLGLLAATATAAPNPAPRPYTLVTPMDYGIVPRLKLDNALNTTQAVLGEKVTLRYDIAFPSGSPFENQWFAVSLWQDGVLVDYLTEDVPPINVDDCYHVYLMGTAPAECLGRFVGRLSALPSTHGGEKASGVRELDATPGNHYVEIKIASIQAPNTGEVRDHTGVFANSCHYGSPALSNCRGVYGTIHDRKRTWEQTTQCSVNHRFACTYSECNGNPTQGRTEEWLAVKDKVWQNPAYAGLEECCYTCPAPGFWIPTFGPWTESVRFDRTQKAAEQGMAWETVDRLEYIVSERATQSSEPPAECPAAQEKKIVQCENHYRVTTIERVTYPEPSCRPVVDTWVQNKVWDYECRPTAECPEGYTLEDGACTPVPFTGWVCRTSEDRAFQTADGTYSVTFHCPNGCENGTCKENPSPPDGQWACKDSDTRAYQDAAGKWSRETPCENGCTDGECLAAPACTPQWTCTNENTRAYQDAACAISQETPCANGCDGGACKPKPEPQAPPEETEALEVTEYSQIISKGSFGTIAWMAPQDTLATGLQVSYDPDHRGSRWIRYPRKALGQEAYAAVLAPPKTQLYSPRLYVRAYAIGRNDDGRLERAYTEWKEIILSNPYQPIMAKTARPMGTPTEAEIPFELDELDLVGLGIEGAKFFTIGSCLDEGWFSVWCAIDVGSTALMIVPVAGQVSAGAKAASFAAKLQKAGTLLKLIKTPAKLASVARKIRLTINGAKYTIKTTEFLKLSEKGFVALGTNGVKRKVPKKIADYGIEMAKAGKADEATELINRLRKSGVTDDLTEKMLQKGIKPEAIETLLKKGAAPDNLEEIVRKVPKLDEIKYIGKDSKNATWWVDNDGWVHFWEKHVTLEVPGGTPFSKITSDLSERNIKQMISDTMRNYVPKKSPLGTRSCYASDILSGGYYLLVIVDSGGKFLTSYPNNKPLNCHDV